MEALIVAALIFCGNSDGDSLICGPERVRVMGVDTPEMDCRCPAECAGAAAAKARTEALIAGGVTLERHGVDRYGRTLARVFLPGGRDLGAVLVLENLGRKYNGGKRLGWC